MAPRPARPAATAKRGQSRMQGIDRRVAARVREQRIMLGLTQYQLADVLGVTYQQAYKYETGINRITAGRLYQIAQTLDAEVSYFFEGLEADQRPEQLERRRAMLELARNFTHLPSQRHQRAICDLARALAGNEPDVLPEPDGANDAEG